MALAVTVDITKTPVEAKAVSDRRVVNVSVSSAGETATGTATFPISFSSSDGRLWSKKSDDGITAIYTG